MKPNDMADWDQRNKFYERIHELSRAAHFYSSIEDFDNYHDCVSNQHTEILGKITDKQEKEAERLENLSAEWAKTRLRHSDNVDPDVIRGHVKAYERYINRLLWQHGMMIPLKGKLGSALKEI